MRLGRKQSSIYPTDNYFEEIILLGARIKEFGTPTESGSLLAHLMPVGQKLPVVFTTAVTTYSMVP